jgi:hypothetical protein
MHSSAVRSLQHDERRINVQRGVDEALTSYHWIWLLSPVICEVTSRPGSWSTIFLSSSESELEIVMCSSIKLSIIVWESAGQQEILSPIIYLYVASFVIPPIARY